MGSINIDRVFRVPRFVQPGETLTATSCETKAGGKGLNQSLAMARAGVSVRHAGCVGSDGLWLRGMLREDGVDVSLVRQVSEPQGTAFIQVSEAGENCIVLYPGSNHSLTERQVAEILDTAGAGDYVVLQNETSCVAQILSGCAERGLRVVFNPAPYTDEVSTMDFGAVAWLVVNEIEVEGLTGTADPDAAWSQLHARWPEMGLVVTLGEQGSVAFSGDRRIVQPAFAVDAVDTTAAGDTFIGYFVAGLADGLPLATCLHQASLAASVTVTRHGAAPSIPWASELHAG